MFLNGVVPHVGFEVLFTVTVFSDVQSMNALSPIEVTLDGIVIDVNFLQYSNGPAFNVVNVVGSVILVKMAAEKAYSPIVVSPETSVTVVNFEHVWNAPRLIVVVLLLVNVTFVRDVHL